MRFMMFYRPAQVPAGPPSAEHLAEMNGLIEEMTKKGVLIDTGAFLPNARGAHVRRSGAEFTVTDGAFPDTPWPMVGYAVLQFGSKEEAIEGAKRFLQVAGDGENEIVPLMDGPGG